MFSKMEISHYSGLIINMNDIAKNLVSRLKELDYKISFCESCTGGMLASNLIGVSGASNVIEESYITYSENAKNKILGVSFETIKNYDVVSKEVSIEMVNGLKKITNSQVCCSVTGYAGPTTNNPNIPVGTFFYSIIIKDKLFSFTNVIVCERNEFRQKVCLEIFNKIYELLQ